MSNIVVVIVHSMTKTVNDEMSVIFRFFRVFHFFGGDVYEKPRCRRSCSTLSEDKHRDSNAVCMSCMLVVFTHAE